MTKAELIGSAVVVLDAPNKSLVGLRGVVVDETQYTIVIKTTQNQKRVFKRGATFRFGTTTIKGDEITKRPEDRVKK